MATPAPLPQRETTRRSRRLRGQKPLSPKSPPAEVVGSAATPPSGGSPLSGAQHHPYIFVSFKILTHILRRHLEISMYCAFLYYVFSYKKATVKQRCRDGVMKDFLSWCRHLLVPFLFHDLTALHPPSFIEMIFH